MRFINWFLRREIRKERMRQVSLGYDAAHDDKELDKDINHLLNQAQMHYNWGQIIPTLALLEANRAAMGRYYTRPRGLQNLNQENFLVWRGPLDTHWFDSEDAARHFIRTHYSRRQNVRFISFKSYEYVMGGLSK